MKWVLTSERLPDKEQMYATKTAHEGVRELYFKKDSKCHWHYPDLTGERPTENVVMPGHVVEWLDESKEMLTDFDKGFLAGWEACEKEYKSNYPAPKINKL